MYALAASAAGVGLLALAQPAEAKIVYTPAHIHIKMNGDMVPLDLNHDGIVDFYLHVYGFFETVILSACQYTGSFSNGTVCSFVRGTNAIRRAGTGYGAALPYGARIQPIRNFGEAAAILGRLKVDSGTYTQWMGPWLNGGKGVKHRYLGLKFKVKGRFHVGWARMTVVTISNNFTATLTGYAYETIPGKGIIAGKTKGPDVTTVSPATLGHLAAGASAIPTWRVKQTKSTTH
jgi:hypothetical protein